MNKMNELLLRSIEQEKTWARMEWMWYGVTAINLVAAASMLSLQAHSRWLGIGNLLMVLVGVWMGLRSRKNTAFWSKNSGLLLHTITCGPEEKEQAFAALQTHLNSK